MWLLIPSIISKHTLLHVNGLKSDRALVKVWHIAAKLSHQTNLAITKLSLSLIHNTIGLGLPMFINATTRQQISIYSIGPYWHLLACTPTFGKVGVETNFFLLTPLTNPDLYPHLKIRGAAAGWVTNKQNNFITVSLLVCWSYIKIQLSLTVKMKKNSNLLWTSSPKPLTGALPLADLTGGPPPGPSFSFFLDPCA